MKKFAFISNKIKEPFSFTEKENIAQLKEITTNYPYFTSARFIYLKALQDNKISDFNREIKNTAAHCTDRNSLFKYITNSKKEQNLTDNKNNNSIKEKTNIQSLENYNSSNDKILSFDKNDTFSFNTWLELDKTSKQKIEKKDSKIEHFIKKISHTKTIKQNLGNAITPIKETDYTSDLATETLAKVYLEQENYTKAITIYRILSLKYPEKSGYFADLIKSIKKQIIKNN